MKVLYIDVNCKNSSTGSIIYSLFSECSKYGIEAAVCYGRGPKIKEKNVYKFGLDFETLIHAFLTRLTGLMGYYSFFSTRRLIKYIKRFNPDIIHIHELHSYFVNVPKILKFVKEKKYKVVFTNHCEFIYTGKCGHSKECGRYSDKCGKCPHLKDYPASLCFDRTEKMLIDKKKLFADWNDCYFVNPSFWISSKMSKSFLSNKKSTVIHNGIDTNLFNFVTYNKEGGPKTIVSVAPNIMSDLKGGFRIIEIAKRCLDKNYKFVIIGDTQQTKIDLPDNVTILPLIKDKNELINYYKNSDLFLICSLLETFPTTCLEAQCCGLPVCGFDVGGVKETILDGNGALAPFEDYEALVNVINTILSNEIDHETISKKSSKEFSNHNMFSKYLEIYNKIL